MAKKQSGTEETAPTKTSTKPRRSFPIVTLEDALKLAQVNIVAKDSHDAKFSDSTDEKQQGCKVLVKKRLVALSPKTKHIVDV